MCQPCAIIALDPHARVLVQRDMELVREILLHVKNKADLRMKEIEIENVDKVVLGRHVEMLYNEGFFEGPRAKTINRADGIPFILVRDLTWAGHDFLAALENKGVWTQIKQKFSPEELAGMPLGLMKDIGMTLLKRWAMAQIGGGPTDLPG